jgi:hypothetical protein
VTEFGPDGAEPAPVQTRSLLSRAGWLGEPAAALYVALIASIAHVTGLAYVMFPELGALAYDILKRPHGTWARAPLLLIVTPFLTAVIGTLVTQHLSYGPVSVLLTVGSAIICIGVLKSPVAPAISAGLLPLTLGVTSWWYPPSLLVGTILLAGIALISSRIVLAPKVATSLSDLANDTVGEIPSGYTWAPFFLAFLVVVTLGDQFGWRLVLFPPLAVIGFEMFAHPYICPWARRPLVLPVACALTATAGVFFVSLLGVGPLAAACSMLFGVAVLRMFDLHAPPALAAGLLPLVMPQPSYRFPVAVAVGTLLLTMSFLAWRRIVQRSAITSG